MAGEATVEAHASDDAAQGPGARGHDRSCTNVILVRHSVPDIDPAVPSFSWTLSAEGRRRAHALSDQLKPLSPDAIYSSPEPKAFETAEILGAALRLAVVTIENLREHDRTGAPFCREPGEYEERVLRIFAQPTERVFGAESAVEALARFRRGIDEAAARGGVRPLLVTHGTVLSLYAAAVSGIDAAALWRQLSMPCYVIPGDAAVALEHLRERHA